MKKLLSILMILFIPFFVFSITDQKLPIINAKSAIMIDYETGIVLYEKNADVQIPPASMTKLMTIYSVLDFIDKGIVSFEDIVPISEAADFRNAPPNSSLMFLEKGQIVTLKELILGLSIPSGNDAGIAIAEYLTGSVQKFIGLMNQNAADIGMPNTHFFDSSGYSAQNTTTARDFANFCVEYIKKYSKYLENFHCQKNFTYPKEKNLPPNGLSTRGPITQSNHNQLIGRLEGVDGLKTGFIDESGYNIAATAKKNGRRIILVLMGGPGETRLDGSFKRSIDAASLFAYGFYRSDRFVPNFPKIDEVSIKGGKKDKIKIVYSKAKAILVDPENLHNMTIERSLNQLKFPINRGDIVGQWKVVDPNKNVIQEGKIFAAENVEEANFFKRLFKK